MTASVVILALLPVAVLAQTQCDLSGPGELFMHIEIKACDVAVSK